MIENLINKIKIELKDLPSKTYQYKMAPSDRDIKITEKQTRKSAVLILLSEKQNKIYITLIKRQEYNGAHSGQISFPGGKYEKYDNNLEETAIRETKEEIGVDKTNYEIIGKLSPLFIPVSAFDVSPFIAVAKKNLNYKKQEQEVKEVIELNLKDFFNPQNIKKEEKTIANKKIIIPYYKIGEYKIWGATAMIISELAEILRRINFA